MTNSLKVSVTLTMQIDPEAWDNEFGTGSDAEVRKDVRNYVLTMVRGSAAADAGAIRSAVAR